MGINPGNPNQARGGNPENTGQFSSDGSRRSETDLSTDLYDSPEWEKAAGIEDDDERVVALADAQGVTMDEPVLLHTDDEGANHYRVTLRCGDREMDAPYFKVSAHVDDKGLPIPPTRDEVLQTIASDFPYAEQDFNSFCDEMGYDPDDDSQDGGPGSMLFEADPDDLHQRGDQSPEWEEWYKGASETLDRVNDMDDDERDEFYESDEYAKLMDKEPNRTGPTQKLYNAVKEQGSKFNDLVDGKAEVYAYGE